MINHVIHQRYEVLEKVGESPLFAVYKARDKGSNRVVALKAVQPPYNADEDFVEALKAGVTASGNLNHPNITRFQEFGVDDGTPYFVTEFVRGINLKERIRRIAPFTLSVATDFACAIGEALHLAHSVGQVHGDLRPQNVIISPEGAVKVTDFGVQRAIARSPQAQRETLLRAAPYHAPELSTTLPGSMSGDIYALGAMLYEMLTGTPLYAGETPEAIAEQHAFSPIPSPRALNPGVPRSIEGIILKCLQKRPEQRYRSAADLLNDLKSVRDALRFGKSLSWSPIEFEKLAAASAAPAAAGVAAAPASAIPMVTPAAPVPEPVAEVAASSIPADMPVNNRLRAQDDRVSIYVKIAIGTVTAIIIVALIGFAAIWSSLWVVPKPVVVPQLVGKPIDDVRAMAQKMNVRLIEHGEYTEKPRNLVYKTDHDNGAQIRPGQTINVWYSKGATYVNVPNVTNKPKEEAERLLKDAGLVVGTITPEFSDKVTIGNVIRQTVSYKKRVLHDTPVDLVISDGPKQDFAADTSGTTDGANPSIDSNTPGNETMPTAPDGTGTSANQTPDEPPRLFDRTIRIPEDGQGIRQVRIEFRDSRGWQPPVIADELHNEGDRIPVTFDYYGKNITLRIYYDDKLKKEFTFDPQDKRGVQ
ncbi:MAG TPA: protein kinase [Chthonomonadaceae bacterium]|nr:protein kinase [Chthonomonadaceae bacterium]